MAGDWIDDPDWQDDEPPKNGFWDIWNRINKPMVPVGAVTPEMEPARKLFEQEHPYIGRGLNFATDVLASLTSPLNAALGVTGLGEIGAKSWIT